VAAKLMESRTEHATEHPASAQFGLRVGGQRRKRQHLTVNNIDICADTYIVVLGITSNLLHTCSGMASSGNPDRHVAAPSAILQKSMARDASYPRVHARMWIIQYAKDSGGELLPMGQDLAKSKRHHAGDGVASDELCSIRLLENHASEVHKRYVAASDSGRLFDPLELTTFKDVFKNDAGVAHIHLARHRDGFSICNTCAAYKTKRSNHYADAAERAVDDQIYAAHLSQIAADREFYAATTLRPQVDRRHASSVPPVIYINICVSLIIDGMTTVTTTIPSMHPSPKALNLAQRLPVGLIGVIIHGVCYVEFLGTPAQSDQCNQTIEVLDRTFHLLQSMGYRFAAEAAIQADNHTDNKTPAVMLYLSHQVNIVN
jgi:hypothetical protein